MKRVGFLHALLLAVPLVAAQNEPSWLDPELAPLPFASETDLAEFLRTARVVAEEDAGEGVNRATKVLLEKDGVRAHAVFREVDVRVQDARVGERVFATFVDSHRFECAAFALASLLGLRSVPPVVPRRIGDREGSLQIWLESVLDETQEDFRPADALAWSRQLWDMYFFDNLIFNVDRNSGNVLVDPGYRLWMIDHTRAFQAVEELLDERVVRVRRSVFDRLEGLTERRLRESLAEYLDEEELRALLVRRDLLVELVHRLVAERGEELVFY